LVCLFNIEFISKYDLQGLPITIFWQNNVYELHCEVGKMSLKEVYQVHHIGQTAMQITP
jgi:hypothetical protein